MGSPYLNSGEVIVLTTDRVSADALLYDVMLTTDRIFLIDNRYARFEPRIIPLSSVLSVQGGKTPGHDPVIMLLFRAGKGDAGQQPLNLVFSQNPTENRKPERDEWVRKLIELSVARQERESVAESAAAADVPRDSGLRPSIRHWIAPEKVRPLSNLRERLPAPAPATVIPDEVEIGAAIPVIGEKSPAETAPVHTFVRGTPPHPSPPARVIIPQIIEEEIPARAPASPPVEQEEPMVAESDHSALTRSIKNAVRSLTAPEEGGLESPPITGTIPVPEMVPLAGSATEPPAGVPESVPEPVQESPETAPVAESDHSALTRSIKNAVRSLTAPEEGGLESPPITGTIPVPEMVPLAGSATEPPAAVPESVPEPVQESPETAPVAESDHSALTRSIKNAVRSLTAPEEGGLESPPITGTIPVPEMVPLAGSATEPPAAVPESVPDKTPEVPEIITGMYAGGAEPVPTEPAAVPEMVQENPSGVTRSGPESYGAPASPEVIMGTPDQVPPESAPHPVPAPTQVPPARHPVPPEREVRSRTKTLAYAFVLLLLVALVAAGAVLLFSQGPAQTGIPVTPTPGFVPVTTAVPESGLAATPVPSLSATLVPEEGVWVRVNSTAYYTGQVGNPELLQQVSGTGDHFYKVLRSNRTVQASVQKQDNSGALLSVEIYRDGTLIGARSVTSPMGTVDLLLNPVTARPPGLTANDTLPENAATPVGRIENY